MRLSRSRLARVLIQKLIYLTRRQPVTHFELGDEQNLPRRLRRVLRIDLMLETHLKTHISRRIPLQIRTAHLIKLELHQDVLIPVGSARDLPREIRLLLLGEIDPPHVRGRVGDAPARLHVRKVDGLLLVLVGGSEIASAVHVPDDGHLAERVAHHGRGEVLGGLQDVRLAEGHGKVVVYHADRFVRQPADLREAVFGLRK